jgi:arylsulfatase
MSSKPNVLLFMVDQLSARWLEAAWSGVCPTPNIDALRARGTSFTQVITSNPVCCPTRATMATGLTTRGHGVLENGYSLDPALPTFMRTLQENSWRTGALGKVHFFPHFAGFYPDYKQFGFDVTHITEDGRGGEWLDWVEANHPEHFESVLATIWPSKIPEYAAYGPDKVDLRSRIEAIRKEFDFATPEFPQNNGHAYTLPFPEEVSQTNWITGHALDFLRETSDGQPFFAQISYVQPHSPFHPPGEYMQYVDPERIPEPAPAEWVDDPHAPHELKRRTPQMPENWRYQRHCYFADIVHLDRQLGIVMDQLEKSGRLDDTYILFFSDHGELFYDHGFTAKEEKHYDACIRVPLIVAGPGLSQGLIRDELVQLEDICPTILDMTDQRLPIMPKTGPYLPIPAEEIPILPGRSMLPLCRGEAVEGWRNAAYCESYNRIDAAHPQQWARTVRTDRFRYTFYPEDGEQLFDLKNDPDEQHNLVANPEFAAIREGLRDQLMTLIVMQDYPKTRRSLFALGVH